MAIQPTAITKYDRTDDELQRFWIFGILVAGKDADWAAHKVGELLRGARDEDKLPFDWLREREVELHNILVANRVGQYGRIKLAIAQSLDLDLRAASLDQLMSVFGVGPKTARFFILHSRPDARVAVLDTHILRWLREVHGYPTPKSTPTSLKQYERIESMALHFMADSFPGLTCAQADLLIWCQMSGRTLADEFVKES